MIDRWSRRNGVPSSACRTVIGACRVKPAHHRAFVSRIEMLDQEDESHSVADRQRSHGLPAGIKPTRRGACSDDRELGKAAGQHLRRQRAFARSRRGGFGLLRRTPWHLALSSRSGFAMGSLSLCSHRSRPWPCSVYASYASPAVGCPRADKVFCTETKRAPFDRDERKSE